MKLLLGIVLVAVFTLAVSSAILFFYFNRIALNQVYRSDLDSLRLTSREAMSMTSTAQSLTFQMYRNTTITQLLYYTDPSVYDTVAAMQELNNYISSMPYLDSIYVYNPKSANVYVAAGAGQNGLFPKEELVDGDILQLLDKYTEYKPLIPIPRYVWTDGNRTKRKAVYTYLFYDAIGSPDNKVNSAIIVNIDAMWINQNIDGTGEMKIGQSFIIDNNGVLQFQEDFLSGLREEEAADLAGRILREPEADYFVGAYGDSELLVSFTEPDDLNWRYVRISPYAEVTRKVEEMRRTTLLITLAILVFGLLFSWLLSRKLYVPIDRMANRVRMLEVEKRNSLFTIRQNFLRNLVSGRESVKPKPLRERLAALGISFDIHDGYRLALIAIDDYPAFNETRGTDEHVYKYAMMNIASELAMQAFEAETIDLGDETIVLLLGMSPASAEQLDEAYLQSMFKQIQKAVAEHLGIGVSVAYTAVDRQFIHLPSLFRQAAEAMKYRFHAGYGSVLYAPATIIPAAREYEYPVDRERRLSEAVLAGKTDDARQIYGEMMNDTRSYPVQAAYALLGRLKPALGQVLRTLEKNHGISFDSNPEAAWPAVERIETRAQVDRWIDEMLLEVREQMEGRRKNRQEELIKLIDDLILEQYADPDLSLQLVAERMNISPSYVGRIYKQHTMRTIVDAIQKVRLEKAMDLLGQTHLSIAEIAERTGFTNASYFHRTFKKHYGMTPNDYRKGNASAREPESRD